MRTGHLFVQCGDRHSHEDRVLICAVCVWTDIVMRTGHLFVQCGDRHSHEDRTLICAVSRHT